MKSMTSEIKTGVAGVQKTGRTAVKAVAGKVAATTSRSADSEKPEKRAAPEATLQLEAGKVVTKPAAKKASAAARKVTAKAATETSTRATTKTKAEATPKVAVKAVSKTKAAPIERPATKAVPPGDEEIRQMIATAAYYRAEKRGFAVGYEREDWLMAEKEVNQILTFGN